MPQNSLRFISPLIHDKKNNIYILTDSADVSVSIADNNVDVLGGAFGISVEDIDNFEKKINITGKVLLMEESNNNIGYNHTSNSKVYNDIYYWLTTKSIPYQYFDNISIDISETTNISIGLRTHSPFLDTTNNSLLPELSIANTGYYSSINESIDEYMKPARLLKFYDLYYYLRNTSTFVSPLYITKVNFDMTFNWTPEKTFQTANDLSNMPIFVMDNDPTSQIPPKELDLLNTIELSLKVEYYIQSETPGQQLEDYLGLKIINGDHRDVALKVKDPSNIGGISKGSMINSIIYRFIAENQIVNWRVVNYLVSASGTNLSYCKEEFKALIKVNPLTGWNELS